MRSERIAAISNSHSVPFFDREYTAHDMFDGRETVHDPEDHEEKREPNLEDEVFTNGVEQRLQG